MATTWYWRAAVGASGVQSLDPLGPPRDDLRRAFEEASTPWLSQRSPSFVLHRGESVTGVVCDALRTHTADEHNRWMRARFTLITSDRDGPEPLRLAVAYFAGGTAPDLSVVDGRLALPEGWDRLPDAAARPGGARQDRRSSDAGDASATQPGRSGRTPAVGPGQQGADPAEPGFALRSDPAWQLRVSRPADFAAAVEALCDDGAALRQSGRGIVCLYSQWLDPDELVRVSDATIVGGPRLRADRVPKGSGGQPRD